MSCNTECCGGTLSCSNTIGGETCVSSYITGCSIEDGQRRCGGGTITVFVGIGVDGCYGTPIFLCHCTLVIGRLEDTVHIKVTLLPVVTEYDGCCTCTVGTSTE